MFYENYYLGMNFFWWFIWLTLLIWIFVTPYDIPGQRHRRISALDVLHMRFASGEIKTEEYNEKRKLIENDLSRLS